MIFATLALQIKSFMLQVTCVQEVLVGLSMEHKLNTFSTKQEHRVQTLVWSL